LEFFFVCLFGYTEVWTQSLMLPLSSQFINSFTPKKTSVNMINLWMQSFYHKIIIRTIYNYRKYWGK
jgi:hypothetical protein